MKGLVTTSATLLAVLSVCAGGCHRAPQHPPADFWGRKDAQRYERLAADVCSQAVATHPCDGPPPSIRPASLQNLDEQYLWDVPLLEAVQSALRHNPIVRQLPQPAAPSLGGPSVPQATEATLRAPGASASAFDTAIQTSNVVGPVGVDAALSAFDASFSTSMFWEKNEQPVNVNQPSEVIFARDFLQDRATFQSQLAKTAVTGGQLFLRHNVVYDANNNPTRAVFSDYNANYELGMTQPLWQGAGRLFNEVAGPGGQPGVYNGVLIARINSDISQLDFEVAVRDLVSQVETAYWELYLAYRALDATRDGRDSALDNWRRIQAGKKVGREDAVREAQARSEFFRFKDRMQVALCDLFAAENRLRYLMGLPASDGRVIRPLDQPTLANLVFDWEQIHVEALARSPELRRQKWRIKQRELELTAAQHFLKPRLDGTAQYRWVGAGDDLMGRRAVPPFAGSDAYSTLFGGDYQEWQLGFQFSMPLGFRRGHAAVRNAELQLARERARLGVQEQELSHLLAEAVRNAECSHEIVATRYETLQAANAEVESALAALPLGRIPYSDVLGAFSRRADAQTNYHRAVVNYRRAIVQIHLRKGSLLEYNEVYLAENPWPQPMMSPKRRPLKRPGLLYRLNYLLAKPSGTADGTPTASLVQDENGPIEATPNRPSGSDLDGPNAPGMPRLAAPPPPTHRRSASLRF